VDDLLSRLAADAQALGGDADWILAALDGDAAFARALGGDPAPARAVTSPAAALPALWLTALEVEGFRGVGPATRIAIEPGPGLTVVVGRNGSGKSSLAEGFEVLLGGDSSRFAGRSAEWRAGWRNLGAPRTRVAATFSAGGSQVVVTRRWEAGDLLSAGVLDGAPAGFPEAVAVHRPFLGTTEMGRMLDDGPSKLFDALRGLLGGDGLTHAVARLSEARRADKTRIEAVVAVAQRLLPRLAEVPDPRAASARGALSGRTWDLTALSEALATDAGVPSEVVAGAAWTHPAPDAVVDEWDAALREVAATDGSRAEIERRAAVVLDAALSWHEAHGDGACPVCGAGSCGADWRSRAVRWRDELASAALEATAANHRLAEAQRRAADWCATLAAPPGAPAEVVESVARARRGRTLDDLVVYGTEAFALAVAWAERCRAEVDQARRAWAEVAPELAALAEQARQAVAWRSRLRSLEAAEKWLKGVEAEVRDAAFRPIATEARQIWELLRQESSVSLDDVRLEGTGTRRRVELAASVDAAEAVALSVMSQGELNALALALFLPRATRPESPFRFVVVDDPVQSMDPAKVDGLARVLAGVADRRQVVVFTHDPRLPDALDRLRLPVVVLEVARRAGSVVELRRTRSPVDQHLLDAERVARDPGVQALAGRVVPALCRAAVEAACDPDALVDAAEALWSAPSTPSEGWWSRAAAVLLRQALEQSLAVRLSRLGVDPRTAGFTAQLLVLEVVLGEALAKDATVAWAQLSEATHVQRWALPPTEGVRIPPPTRADLCAALEDWLRALPAQHGTPRLPLADAARSELLARAASSYRGPRTRLEVAYMDAVLEGASAVELRHLPPAEAPDVGQQAAAAWVDTCLGAAQGDVQRAAVLAGVSRATMYRRIRRAGRHLR
jgi:energy-coupling factor transporter ATP-binding protein EcfA2